MCGYPDTHVLVDGIMIFILSHNLLLSLNIIVRCVPTPWNGAWGLLFSTFATATISPLEGENAAETLS